jgi:Ca2+/H+ antiporter
MGQALGGLMNATFGNAVELIVSHCSFVFLSSLFVDLSILYAPFHLPWLLTLDG